MIDSLILNNDYIDFNSEIIYEIWESTIEGLTNPRQINVTTLNPADSINENVGLLIGDLKTSEFVHVNNVFKNTYVEQVVDYIKDTTKFPIGRVRFLLVGHSSTYEHKCKKLELRLHIPIKTNNHCYYIVDGKCYTMPLRGRTYSVKTNESHTVLNANTHQFRLHLVFETYTLV